jgi:GDP-D-mannose dehydratase
MMKKVLITGVTGQDGAYLARFLLSKGYRPAEMETLLGDPTRARGELGWALDISFPELVREMVESDYQAARREGLVRAHGYEAYRFHESTELAFQKELF